MQYRKHRKFADVDMYRFGYSPIGKPWLSVYCYLIDRVLIDTAQSNCQEKVVATFQNKAIEKILLTHWHEDHSGNTTKLAQLHNSKVYAHPFTKEKLRTGFDILPYEKFLFGKTTPFEGQIGDFQDLIETTNHKLTPIFTPGHADDHTVFLDKDHGWLFSGDLYVGVKIKVFRKGEQFWQQVDSFKKVLAFDFDVLFCGHHPRLKDGKLMLAKKLQYFEDFGGKTLFLHQKGLSTKEIMETMKLRENNLLKLLLSNDVSVTYMIEAAINKC
ncbi:MBL fold metallo-hydrolase [Emticicia sp. SJ17W-69]|uniref:MBL fold metallo-hydrolase n=1 Tax=Emticicia sp. SJ17W-69 TaxID=3421657 RepID=UPI003EB8328D